MVFAIFLFLALLQRYIEAPFFRTGSTVAHLFWIESTFLRLMLVLVTDVRLVLNKGILKHLNCRDDQIMSNCRRFLLAKILRGRNPEIIRLG